MCLPEKIITITYVFVVVAMALVLCLAIIAGIWNGAQGDQQLQKLNCQMCQAKVRMAQHLIANPNKMNEYNRDFLMDPCPICKPLNSNKEDEQIELKQEQNMEDDLQTFSSGG